MAVDQKAGGGCGVSGRTWNPMTTARNGDYSAPMPCYELAWDADGKASHTGRYALKTMSEIERSAMTRGSLGIEAHEDEPGHEDNLIPRTEALRLLHTNKARRFS